ncbi:MAG: hypothetical protein ABH872_00605 [Candidatus Omnitrophota bacterium]
MLVKMKKAQSTAEYAILFALVVAAAMGIQNYVKRGLEARVFDAVNDYVATTGGQTLQYEGTSGEKITTNQRQERTFVEDFDNQDSPITITEDMKADHTSFTRQ